VAEGRMRARLRLPLPPEPLVEGIAHAAHRADGIDLPPATQRFPQAADVDAFDKPMAAAPRRSKNLANAQITCYKELIYELLREVADCRSNSPFQVQESPTISVLIPVVP
jgi:hypothetical protein